MGWTLGGDITSPFNVAGGPKGQQSLGVNLNLVCRLIGCMWKIFSAFWGTEEGIARVDKMTQDKHI